VIEVFNMIRGAPRLLLLGALLFLPGRALSWQATIAEPDPYPDSGLDTAGAVAIDGDGNVVVGGNVYTANSNGAPVPGFAIFKFDGLTGEKLWETIADNDDRYRWDWVERLVMDPFGDVIAAGHMNRRQTAEWDMQAVVKLSGETGSELWSRTANRRGKYDPTSVATDDVGDVLLAVWQGGEPSPFSVMKFAGADGSDLWTASLAPATENAEAHGLSWAVIAEGEDVFAAGQVTSRTSHNYFAVARIHGQDGTVTWQQIVGVPGGGAAHSVAVTPQGDVVAAGTIDGKFAVAVLAREDGKVLWVKEIELDFSLGKAGSVAVDSQGNVIAAGVLSPYVGAQTDDGFFVVKLSGSNGSEIWQYLVDGRRIPNDMFPYEDKAKAVVVDAEDNVFAVGHLFHDEVRREDLYVVKLSGETGSELWSQSLDGTGSERTEPLPEGPPETENRETANDVAFDGAGDVVAVGNLYNLETGGDLVVAKFRGADGAISRFVEGRRLVLSQNEVKPTRNRISFAGRERRRTILPAPGTSADPTLTGGRVVVENPTTGETMTIDLPAENWTGLGKHPGSRGYRYKDPEGTCRSALLRRGTVKVKCKGQALAFSLDEPEQGSLAVRLSTGNDVNRYAVHFGGSIAHDRPATLKRAGLFKASDAPASEECPVPLP
jgi:hypothetical protein